MALTTVTNISGGLGYESAWSAPWTARNHGAAAVVTVGSSTYVGGFQFYSNFLGFTFVRCAVFRTSDNGVTWSQMDSGNQPDKQLGTGPRPKCAVSYDGKKIGFILPYNHSGSDGRAQVYEFDLNAGATFEKWITAYDGGTGGPTFTFPAIQNISASSLVGQSDGSWLWLYINTVSYFTDNRVRYSVYSGANVWAAVHVDVESLPLQSEPKPPYTMSMTPTVSLGLQACADSGLSHIWWEYSDYELQTTEIRHSTVTGSTLGGTDVSYSSSLPAPYNSGGPNYTGQRHAMNEPIIWDGKIVMPVGKIVSSGTTTWDWRPALWSCASGGSTATFSEEVLSTTYGSYQLNVSRATDGKLLILFKNYLQSGSNQEAFFKATKSTGGGATSSLSVLWDIQTWAGTTYYPNSPYRPPVSTTPNRWIDNFYAVPSTAYDDGLWLVTDLSPKPQFSGSPAFLYAAYGTLTPPPDCCCADTATAY